MKKFILMCEALRLVDRLNYQEVNYWLQVKGH